MNTDTQARPKGVVRGLAVPALMTASGFAGLGYQIVWTRQVTPWVGNEAAAVLAVVTAFFGGLAVGAFVLGPAIERSRRPALWYVACEALIGCWAILLLFAVSPFGSVVMETVGVRPSPIGQSGIAFGATFLLFLPATGAMGATLPAIERATAQATHLRSLAAPYAFNTAGAVLGVLVTTFWLVPTLGVARTAAVCAALNLACAAGGWSILSRPVAHSTDASGAPPSTGSAASVTFRLWLTGLLGIGYEVLVVRVLSQVAEDTVYTFASLLAVYLTGTTVGAAIYRRRSRRWADAGRAVETLTVRLASACLVGTGALYGAGWARDFLLERFPAGMAAALTMEAVLALAAFAAPTIVMGMLFTALCDRARDQGSPYGRSIGFNTLGAACAPLVFGVVLVPAIGPKASLVAVVAGYVASAWPFGAHRSARRWPAIAASATVTTAAAAILVLAPPLAFVDVPEGGRKIFYEDGVSASVSVVEDAAGVARLRIDDRQQEGTSATAFVDGRQALLPILLHPAPHRALFLGLGTGVTARTAAGIPGLQVDAVELLPEVVEASHRFADPQDETPSLHVVVADARRYVRASTARYDVIVADNFHPARAGSGTLYTVEHFAAVRARLGSAGVFCQWIPLHQLDLATLRSIVATFVDVFPGAFAVIANNGLDTPVVGLVAVRDDRLLDPKRVEDRIAATRVPALGAFGLDDRFAVLGSTIAGPASLRRFARDAPLNRDDRPVVAFQAPRATYAPEASPRRRLSALLDELSVQADEIVDPSLDPDFATRRAAYRHARDRFIAIGQDVRPTADVVDMLAQVREPLLAVLRLSPDFRPAYDPLVAMAIALSRSDPRAAAILSTALVDVRPERLEARSLRDRLARADASEPQRREVAGEFEKSTSDRSRVAR